MITKCSLLALLALAGFVSCSDKDKTDESAQIYNSVIIDTPTAKKTGADSSLLNSMFQRSVGSRNLTGLPANTTQSTSSPLPGNISSKLNPAHGQPGHRCEIAVGAPLDSKPSEINPTQIKPEVSANQIVPVTNAPPILQNVAAGVNPAHGQPTHRCDIAVGAPLTSKPTINTAISSNIKPAAPSAVVSTPPGQKVAPGMNPAHGQPNHRCDLAVGEPLNSKPAANTTKAVVTGPPPALADSVKK